MMCSGESDDVLKNEIQKTLKENFMYIYNSVNLFSKEVKTVCSYFA